MRIAAALAMLSACTFPGPDDDDPEVSSPPPAPTQPPTPPPVTETCPDVSTIDDVRLVYQNESITDPVIANGGTSTFFIELHDASGWAPPLSFRVAARSDTTIVAQPQDTYGEIFVHPRTGKTDVEIYEPCTGKLLGTAFITAAPVDHVAIIGFPDAPLTDSDQAQFAQLILADITGHALVDESAHVRSPDSISQFVAWDLIAYGSLAPGAHAFTVTSNAVDYTGSMMIE